VVTACNRRAVLVEPSPPLNRDSTVSRHPHHYWKEKPVYICINKDGNPSTISTRHVKANINTGENKQNNRNEVEDLMLTGHALP
jgi:hypothetical protein